VIVAFGALLQLLPSTEFWHGGNTNALTAMTSYMTKIAQPHWLAWLSREVAHSRIDGGGFNVVVSVARDLRRRTLVRGEEGVALARVGLGGGCFSSG